MEDNKMLKIDADPEEIAGAVTEAEVQLEGDVVAATEVETRADEVIVKIFGTVSGCSKLNIRKRATKDAEVLCVVPVGTKLLIDRTTDQWYAVETEDGVKGFAMKDFITLKQKEV